MTTERRRVLKVLATCAGAAAAGVGVVPSLAFVGEPGTEGAGEGPRWVRVARLDALEPGVPAKSAIVGAQSDAWSRAPERRLGAVWLVRDPNDRVRAYSAVCPHLGCAIDFAGDHFVCPCHDSAFGMNGEARTGPSPRGMDPIEARVADGWVQVRYKRFRLGVSERIEA